MELASEYILGKALTLTESIVRRVCYKAGEQTGNRFGMENNRSLNDVMNAIEKETTQILDCLASQQQSKIDSAYQYIKFAMSDLQAWNEECTQLSSRSSLTRDITSPTSPLSLPPSFTISTPIASKNFQDAIWQLRQADEWATEAFNDKRNSKALVRIEALHIRLFCRALLDWENKKIWFSKWRQVLEPFFADRQFVKYAMGEQSFTSRLFSDEKAKPVCQRFVQLTKCLERLMWDMVLKGEATLGHYAREFALHFDRNTTLAPDVKLASEWRGLRSFHLSFYDLTDDIELKLCADKLVIRLYEFKAITSAANGQVWAIEHGGRMVSFEVHEPQNQTLVINDHRKWLCLGYCKETSNVYATCEDQSYVSIFDALSGREMNETYELPPGHTKAYAYQMKLTSGIILLKDKGTDETLALFIDEETSTRKWRHLRNAHYDVIARGGNSNEIIGLRLNGYYLTAEVMKKDELTDQIFVTETIQERLLLPQEPKAHLMTVREEFSDDSRNYAITVACQTEKLNYMISIGLKTDERIAFIINNVHSFDTKYTDWQMAKEMIQSNEKFFILFR